MTNVHNLLDDMALACECGCVGFNYLKSHKLECEWCGKQIDLVKNAVNNFLSWKLPKDFSPDGGISFKADFNENTQYPMKHEPLGTNLLHAGQAKEMIEAMLDGIVGETK